MTIEERILEIERRLEDMKRQSQAALALATACVETLEQRRATTEESSAPEPAPAAYRPLWREVRGAMQAVPDEFDWVAAQLAVADWLAARGCADSADMLRAEARQARKGA